MTTADGVEIVVGMTVWWHRADRAPQRLVVAALCCDFGDHRDSWRSSEGWKYGAKQVFSTRSAAIDAELARLRAEIARVEGMRAEGGGE